MIYKTIGIPVFILDHVNVRMICCFTKIEYKRECLQKTPGHLVDYRTEFDPVFALKELRNEMSDAWVKNHNGMARKNANSLKV